MRDKRQVQEVIQDVVRRIVVKCAPQKVILFGSYAYGEPDEDSDLDFLVVMDTALPPLERYLSIQRAMGPLDIPVDILSLTPQEFEETRDVIGGLAYAPAKYGQVVYEKS